MTKLEKTLKRELLIDGEPYVLTLDPQGMKLTEKGRRLGQELRWKDWVSGQAALAVALNASLAPDPTDREKTHRPPAIKRRRAKK